MNDETKNMFALESAPETGGHRARFCIGLFVLLVGAADFVVNGIIRDTDRTLMNVAMDAGLLLAGLGVVYTKTMIELSKAAFPFLKR